MKWTIALVIALTSFTGALQSTVAQGCPNGALPMRAGDNLQSLVNVASEGAIFCLEAGTYRRASITPQDGQQFIALGTVTFDGESATEIAFNGVLEPNNTARNRENVTIRGITFTNYRTSQWNGKGVLVPSAGWVIENVVIRNSTSAIMGGKVNWTCASDFVLRDVWIENISHAAIYWNATHGLTERVTVRNSGYSLSRSDADWYGIVKYQNQPIWADNTFTSRFTCVPQSGRSLIVQDSVFENLNGVGWWCDISCRDVVFQRNVVRNNQWSGLMFEISGGGHNGAQSNVIQDNVFACNRRSNIGGGGWGGAEIFLPNANGIIVRGNDITVCSGGRAFSIVYEAGRVVPTRDILIEGNTIRLQPGAVFATITCCSSGWADGKSIVFRGNRYYVNDVSAQSFEWTGRVYNWQSWSAFMDAGSTFAPLGSEVPTTPTPTASVVPTALSATPTPTFTTIAPTGTPPAGAGCFQIAAVDSRVLLIPVECPQSS